MFAEERLGRLPVQQTGHHIPGERFPEFFPGAEDRGGEVFEQGLAGYRRDRIGSFRAVESEPGSLPAGDSEAAHFAGAQQFDAARFGFFVEGALCLVLRHERKVGRRTEILRDPGLRPDQHVVADQFIHLIEVDGLKLPGQFLLLCRGKFRPEAEQLFLVNGGEAVKKLLTAVHDCKVPSMCESRV